MDYISASVNNFESWTVSRLKLSISEAQKKNQKTLPVLINSYGGSVYNLLQIVDLLDASGLNIVTIVNGVAMSAGAVLFAYGTKRYISKNSTVMVHDVSAFAIGKSSELDSMVSHVADIEKRLYGILDSQSGKPEGYFENLVMENKGADLYLNADQAIEHGIATDIGIPSMNEIMNFKPERINNSKIYSEYEKLQIFVQGVPGDTQADNNNFKEVPPVDLKAVLSSLNDEQKKPVLELQKVLEDTEKEVKRITDQLSEKEQEITSIKTGYEEKITSMVNEQDKEFVNLLLKNHQISKADMDKELKALSELSAVPTAKALYKERLAKTPKVVEGQIPDNGERDADMSNPDSEEATLSAVKAYCKKNNIEFSETSVSSIQAGFKAYAKSLAN